MPDKDNSNHGQHADSQFCHTQVAYMREFAEQFADEVAVMSCDNKNKINIGTLAVSRYHQIRRIFSLSDKPQYADHDFPFAKAKIVPSGYMLLEPKRSVSCQQDQRSFCFLPSQSAGTSAPLAPQNKKHTTTSNNGEGAASVREGEARLI